MNGSILPTDARPISFRGMGKFNCAAKGRAGDPATALRITFTHGVRKGDDGQRYLLIHAYLDARKVGFVEGRWNRACASNIFVHVDEPMRGRGIGTALLARFVQAARRAGRRSVCAKIAASNTSSLRACARAGFRRVRTRGGVVTVTHHLLI
jgi:GNAT superfamily N-acetyltransferase